METDEMATYGIWCEVWGGITGSRASWLKDHGELQTYSDPKQAQQRADVLNEIITNNPHRTAEFRYTVKVITS
jgi:hypothetical protein